MKRKVVRGTGISPRLTLRLTPRLTLRLTLQLALWLTVLLLLWNQPAAAQTPAVVMVQPAVLSLIPGERVELAVAVDQAEHLFGFQLHLDFDPTVIQIVDADPRQDGVQVQAADFLDISQGFAVANQANNEAGTVDFAMTLLAPAEPASGAGDLIHLPVLAVAVGSSQLSLSVVLASKDGQALQAETMDGRLTVVKSEPSSETTAQIPVTPGVSPAEGESAAATQPSDSGEAVPSQSGSTVDDPRASPPAAVEGEAGSSPSPGDPSLDDGETVLTPADEDTAAQAENAALTAAEAATPIDAASAAVDEPAERVTAAGEEEVSAIEGEGSPDGSQPATEEPGRYVLWIVLAALLVVLAGIVLGRRMAGSAAGDDSNNH